MAEGRKAQDTRRPKTTMSNVVTPTLTLSEHSIAGLPDQTDAINLPAIQLFPGVIGGLIAAGLKKISIGGSFTTEASETPSTDPAATAPTATYELTETFTATDNIPLVPKNLLSWSHSEALTEAEYNGFNEVAPGGVNASAVLKFV